MTVIRSRSIAAIAAAVSNTASGTIVTPWMRLAIIPALLPPVWNRGSEIR
jgi:hypothetical protein